MKTRRMIPADSTWTKPAPDYYTRMIDYRCSSPDSVYSQVEHEKLVHSIPQGNKVDWGHEWALIRILSEKHDPSSPILSFLWVSREGVLDSNRVIGYNVISISRSSDMSLNLRGCKFGASALRKCREIVLDDARQRGYQSYILSALVNPNDLSAICLCLNSVDSETMIQLEDLVFITDSQFFCGLSVSRDMRPFCLSFPSRASDMLHVRYRATFG